jgi:hypothetical protein
MIYAAGIALQKYINTHWSEAAEKFQPPLIADGVSATFRIWTVLMVKVTPGLAKIAV